MRWLTPRNHTIHIPHQRRPPLHARTRCCTGATHSHSRYTRLYSHAACTTRAAPPLTRTVCSPSMTMAGTTSASRTHARLIQMATMCHSLVPGLCRWACVFLSDGRVSILVTAVCDVIHHADTCRLVCLQQINNPNGVQDPRGLRFTWSMQVRARSAVGTPHARKLCLYSH